MTVRILALLTRVTLEFFWGEAIWGLTAGLRQLRWMRLVLCIIPFVAVGTVVWAVVGSYAANRSNDSYSYYEGKVLEERMNETRRMVDGQGQDIKRILEQQTTSTLLAVRMQTQIDQMRELLSAGIKVLGAVVIAIAGSLLKDIFQIRLRSERAKIGRRREGNNK